MNARVLCVWIAMTTSTLAAAQSPGQSAIADAPSSALLRSGDRIALVGGTLVERMQVNGDLEFHLQTMRPDWQLRVRNLGWSGDDVHATSRRVFEGREAGLARRMSDLRMADPTVTLVFYGQAEASAGLPPAEAESALARWVTDVQSNGSRVILVTPLPMPGYRVPDYRTQLSSFSSSMRDVARRSGVPCLELAWTPGAADVADDGLLPSDVGMARLGRELAEALLGEPSVAAELPDSTAAELRSVIAKKDRWFFHRHRPQNETYLFLFRRHEQGNNAAEVELLDEEVARLDRAIWSAAKFPAKPRP